MNKRQSVKREITQERLHELLSYDPEEGVFRWRNDGRGTKAGRQAGTSLNGYIIIDVLRNRVFAHRLAWFYVHGSWPPDQLDHISRIRSDNRISNLREATRSQNMANSSVSRASTSGVKGVSWHKNIKRWVAKITYDWKTYNLGTFHTKEEAAEAYEKATKQFFGEFGKGAARG